MNFSLAVAIAIFFMIAIRQGLPQGNRVWRIMTAGALLLLVTGRISPHAALLAVNWNVIIVQQTERFGTKPFTFWHFTVIVIPVTVVSIVVSYAWVVWVMAS